ncbi:MAG: hypothetical protein Q4B60_09465 [Erysipelotrichaceae bacterium]|nr:hypothetical protein [Erysipelotrichaceae bacterium]
MIILLILLICLIPVPLRLKDGGTVVYKAILYQVEDIHRILSENEYMDGLIIRVLGFEVYNNLHK